MTTIADIILSGIEYEDIYDLTSIAVGTEVVIQNKSSGIIYIQIAASQPPNDSSNGVVVEVDHRYQFKISEGLTNVWAKGSGPVSIQETTIVTAVDVVSSTGNPINVSLPYDVQHPLPTDGDRVYVKDIDVTYSDNGDFSGDVTDYFDSLKSINTNNSATSPKTIKLWFNATISTHAVGFGCDDLTKSFSNIVIKALGSGEAVRFTKDLSSDDTKRNSYLVKLPTLALNGIELEFHTTDEVCLSNLIIFKSKDVHATLSATQDNGEVVDLGATDSGNLKVSDAENGLAISKGIVVGSTFVHKFGNAPDFDASDGLVTIWDGADDDDIDQMRYVYSTTNDIDSVVSSNTSDTQLLKIQGLDENYNLVTQNATLNGQNRVALSTPLIRVFRMKNDDITDNLGHIYCYVNTTLSGGVPVDSTKVRAIIQPLNNQTLMAVYTIPAGYTGYMRDWYAATAGSNKTTNYVIELRARDSGKVFQLKHISSISDNGTSHVQHNYNEPEKFAEKVDIEMRCSALAGGTTGASISAGFDIVLIED